MNHISEAIVLAGGMGTRLRSLVSDLPKPMAPVAGHPFLRYVLDYLHAQHIKRVVLSVGYKWESIQAHFGDEYQGMELAYAVEETPLGTGGGIRLACEQVRGQHCFVVNGDTWFGVALDELAALHLEKDSILTLALKPMRDFDRYGTVELDEQARIRAFEEKQPRESGLINGGIYLLDKRLWEATECTGRFSFEQDIMEQEVGRLAYHGYKSEAYFIDIGIPEDYQKAQVHFAGES